MFQSCTQKIDVNNNNEKMRRTLLKMKDTIQRSQGNGTTVACRKDFRLTIRCCKIPGYCCCYISGNRDFFNL